MNRLILKNWSSSGLLRGSFSSFLVKCRNCIERRNLPLNIIFFIPGCSSKLSFDQYRWLAGCEVVRVKRKCCWECWRRRRHLDEVPSFVSEGYNYFLQQESNRLGDWAPSGAENKFPKHSHSVTPPLLRIWNLSLKINNSLWPLMKWWQCHIQATKRDLLHLTSFLYSRNWLPL